MALFHRRDLEHSDFVGSMHQAEQMGGRQLHNMALCHNRFLLIITNNLDCIGSQCSLAKTGTIIAQVTAF